MSLIISPKGEVYFDNETLFVVTDFTVPQVKAYVRGALFSDLTKLNNYTVLYPPDQTVITKKSVDDLNSWVQNMKNSKSSSAYLNSNGYSFTENIASAGWIAGLVIFLIGYFVLLIIGIVFLICECMRCQKNRKYNKKGVGVV